MSTQPGVTSKPSASSSWRPGSSSFPTAVILSPSTATSAVRGRSTPKPSTTRPPRMMRSCKGLFLSGGGQGEHLLAGESRTQPTVGRGLHRVRSGGDQLHGPGDYDRVRHELGRSG